MGSEADFEGASVSSDRSAQEERKDSFTTARRNARAMTAHPALEKMTLDAFHSTRLNDLQRANEIETVAFEGFRTNWRVESSARSAYDVG